MQREQTTSGPGRRWVVVLTAVVVGLLAMLPGGSVVLRGLVLTALLVGTVMLLQLPLFLPLLKDTPGRRPQMRLDTVLAVLTVAAVMIALWQDRPAVRTALGWSAAVVVLLVGILPAAVGMTRLAVKREAMDDADGAPAQRVEGRAEP